MSNSITHGSMFVCTIEGIAPQLITPVVLMNGDRICKAQALWDTGSFYCSMSKKCAEELRFIAHGEVQHTGIGGTEVSDCGLIDCVLPNDVFIPNIITTVHQQQFENFEVIIGLNVIYSGDFVVSHDDDNTIFAFRYPALGIDGFTKD